jgi:hypothetical protein
MLTALSITALAQEEDTYAKESETTEGHLNRIGLCSGLTFVPTDLTSGKKDFLVVPTYGLEYERRIKKWFALGIVNEFELENYMIEHETEESIERSYIYVVSILAFFKPVKNLVIFAGPGYELTSEHNFEVLKMGVSYEFELSEKWDLAPLLYLDRVSDLYTTYSFGLSIGRRF